MQVAQTQIFSVDLKIVNADSTISVADGVLEHYNDDYDNNITNADAVKFTNTNENIAIISMGATLSMERRKLPLLGDTLHIKFTGIKNTNYQLAVSVGNFSITGLQPQLYDKFLKVNTPVSDNVNTVTYPFIITGDPLSTATDRFGIVYKNIPVLPYVLNLTAHSYDVSSVALAWKVDKELYTSHYEIQKADETDSFTTISSAAASNNDTVASYQYNDLRLATFTNFYRIKSVGENGDVRFSDTIKIAFAKPKNGISIWPNPFNR